MPEQGSQRGNSITEAGFEQPFSTPIFPFGGKLVVSKAVDALAPGECARLTNVHTFDVVEGREFSSRLGLFNYASAPATQVHSLVRVELPQTGSYVRFAGAGSTVSTGTGGVAFAEVDSGYSGGPMNLLPHRPDSSGDPWVFVGDAARNRKIRATDGLVMPIGLPAPDFAATAALAAQQQTSIANFTSDGTQAGEWTPNAGSTYNNPPAATPVPTVTATTVPVVGSAGVFFNATAAAPVTNGYFVFFGAARTMNLNTVGAVPASDDDYIHLYLYLSQTARIQEVRIYFVVSAVFSESILPGVGNAGGANLDSYMKAFNQNDMASFVAGSAPQISAAETARMSEVRDAALMRGRGQAAFEARRRFQLAQNAAIAASVEASRAVAEQGQAGSETWAEYGAISVPLRRGDFQRLGQTPNRNWGTVTGMVVMVRAAAGATNVTVGLSNMYLTGGSGPDTGEPTQQPYDYRYTNFDPRTGSESNPSPEMLEDARIDTLRRSLTVTPVPYGDDAIRQRFYRRGGSLNSDWYFEGQNDADGGVYADSESDLALAASATLELDHYEAVPTLNDAGETVLAQPVTCYFGPYNGQLFALGDPYRPGYVYASIPGQPDLWPPDLAHEVCAPSEQLLAGLMFGGQPYVFSRDRLFVLYPNISGVSGMTSQPTGCTRGLAGSMAWCTGAGFIWFVSQDGAYKSSGGGQAKISHDVDPLFLGRAANGYAPIDYTDTMALRCQFYENELYIQYRDTDDFINLLVYQPLTESWRHYQFAIATCALYAENAENGTNLLLGENGGGTIYDHSTENDDGEAIVGNIRTGSWDWGRPREEKLFGDQILDANLNGNTIVWTNYLNSETVVNTSVPIFATPGRTRVIVDGFGTTGPQKGRNLAVDITWEALHSPPTFYFLGTAITLQPDLTVNRVTNWDDLGSPDEVYLTGVNFDCDTGGVERTIIIERDFGGATFTVATLSVTAVGRHKLRFSWPAVQANQVRVRPSGDCLAWLLYRADWIFQKEPPRIARWDVHFENGWDQYYTGLDLYCDTNGATKQIQVTVDGVTLSDPATGQAFFEVTTIGRQVVHLTLPWGRGHVFHFVALDDHPGLLYEHRWHLKEEPSEQANWNQPFTIMGTQADKWVKAIILEIDTFGEDKTITIEADNVVVDTFTVNTDGRLVRQVSLPTGQKLGRVWRIWPTDAHPSRLYTARPVFDEEPFSLEEWNTQQIDHGISGFHFLHHAMVTLKSTADVTLRVSTYINQTGTVVTDDYVIPSTAGVKLKRFVPFQPRKGVLYQYHFLRNANHPFWLYREESSVIVQPWEGGAPQVAHPFGNDDLDQTRTMTNATLAASTSGGGT